MCKTVCVRIKFSGFVPDLRFSSFVPDLGFFESVGFYFQLCVGSLQEDYVFFWFYVGGGYVRSEF